MAEHVVILGGGLAGLSCGYELALRGVKVTVLEREDHAGGMASSFSLDDGEQWSYDFGPHRFHTTDDELIEHVERVLDGNRTTAHRLSRIVLFNRFFDYPLNAGNVLRNLPPHILVKAFLDYFWVRLTERLRLSRYSDENFEGWVTRRFGRTLYKLFFGRYTEKAWKMPAHEISGDWASQRISLLSLTDTVKKALFAGRGKGGTPRTLVTEFLYPETGGIGEIARGYVREIEARGGRVLTGAPAIKVLREGDKVVGVEHKGASKEVITGDAYISTIPITALARSVRPGPPEEVKAAISELEYVSIIFVYLKVNKPQVSPDSWLYLPENHLTVHRISEFKNFSPNAAPPDKTMVCAEITCRIGDRHWRAKDEELIETAVSDLESIGLITSNEVLPGAFVKKIPYAYPVYDLEYKEHLLPIMEFVHSLENIKTGGRQGLFRYNNMDQSIEMGRKMGWAVLEERDAGHEAVATGQEYFG